VAIIDDTILISSANLTDDAFNRNLEVGVLINNAGFLISINTYLDALNKTEHLAVYLALYDDFQMLSFRYHTKSPTFI